MPEPISIENVTKIINQTNKVPFPKVFNDDVYDILFGER